MTYLVDILLVKRTDSHFESGKVQELFTRIEVRGEELGVYFGIRTL